jgi:hypothetical protein
MATPTYRPKGSKTSKSGTPGLTPVRASCRHCAGVVITPFAVAVKHQPRRRSHLTTSA